MFDREIVASIVEGDPAGLAAAYDQYARGLYSYCRSLLAEPADAADAVHDTFIIASAKVSGLREPERLRSWLYAVARNECHRRLRASATSAPLDESAEMVEDVGVVGVEAEQAELRTLVWAALSGLNSGDREIIELNLRHEIDGNDLADTLGVPRNQAHALASRARSQFETSLGVLLVARSGREYCVDLAAILDGWDGELTALIRKRVNRHIERCEVCDERKRRELSPAMLLSLLPVAMLPSGLREEIIHLVADISPDAETYCGQVAHRAGPFSGSGFPVQLTSPVMPRSQSSYVVAAAAGAAALALVGGVLFLLLGGGSPAAVGNPEALPGPAGGVGALVASPSAAAPVSTPTPSPGHRKQPAFTTPLFSAPVPSTSASSPAPVLPKPTPKSTPKSTPKPTKTPTGTSTTPTGTSTTPTGTSTTPTGTSTTPTGTTTTPTGTSTTPTGTTTTPTDTTTSPAADPNPAPTDTATTAPPPLTIVVDILGTLTG